MKRFFKNYFFLAFILILTLAFLVGCAKQKVQIQVEEKPTSTAVVKEEPAKPAPEPPKPEPPAVSEPPKKETPPAPPPAKIEPPPPPSAPVAIPPPPTPVQPEIKKPAQRTTEVARSSVNLRKGPSMKGRITRVLKKGTKLIVLEEKEGWLHVRLKDGAEGWIAKSMTTERAQPSPAAPPKGKK
ncbi:MAG: SH3 domain-containing protein [Deltaproteobacteria bacterium]|nr:SH3 domain-containing protein [Deltaproteobacteria bacterium]